MAVLKSFFFVGIGSFIFLTSSKCLAQWSTPQQALDLLHRQYNARFNDQGQDVSSDQQAQDFKKLQDQVILYLKNKKYLVGPLAINNDTMAELKIGVYMVIDQNRFIGIYVERSKYLSPRAETFLRLYNLTILNAGMDVFRTDGISVIRVQTFHAQSNMGTVGLTFPLDFNNRKFTTQYIYYIQKNMQFVFTDLKYKPISSIDFSLWYNAFPFNAGVRSIIMK